MKVKTMYETGKLAQVATEMRRYDLPFLGISKSTGPGKYRTNTEETVLSRGRDDDSTTKQLTKESPIS